jgi:hypothetical protein
MSPTRPYLKDAFGIRINRLIIHVLDPDRPNKRNSRGFIPSQAELNLQNRPELLLFFTNHIAKSLANPSSRVARFKNINSAAPSGICADVLAGSKDFVDGSIAIAKKLFAIMQDGRTKSADLVVALFEAENFPNEQFLALLKVDPSQAFRHNIIEIDGKMIVDYETLPSAFTEQELQKCAFIQSVKPSRNPEYDMVMLDLKQEGVAQYFKDKLLDAEESYDAKARTQKLWQAFVQAGNFIRDNYSSEQLVAFELQREAAMGREQINYEELVNSLNLPGDGKASVLGIFRDRLPDREIEIDQEYAEKIAQKRVFQGDYGLNVRVESEYYDQVIRMGEDIIEDGEVVGREVIVRARNWHEVAK